MNRYSAIITSMVVILFLVGIGSTAGATEVSGLIDINTTWTVSNSPYIVVGSVNVASGVTLTIEPGVEVKFDGVYEL